MTHPHHSHDPLGDLGGIYTDFYELTMAQGYYEAGKAETEACFDYFFRKVPSRGGYVVFSGLKHLLEQLEALGFPEQTRRYLADQGLSEAFVDYLADFEFRGTIYAPREGEIVFPYEPVIRVEGPLLETQIVETLLLNLVNFESLIATKASRMRHVAGDRKLIDFGLRRAHGYSGIQAPRAAIVGGFDATSNVYSGLVEGLEITGTQAHSWIQSFDSELEAFEAYAETFPEKTILLVDTYDTLDSGVPNAVEVAKQLEKRGHRLIGIRLDSGDLAYLSKKARSMLDSAGLEYVKIAVSNQLDEHVIRSLIQQDAPIDVFGVGTQLVTAYEDPALDGVYKLSQFDGKPRIKLSESYQKVNFPGKKQVFRLFDDDGQFYGDAVSFDDESVPDRMHHPYEPDMNVDIRDFSHQPLLRPVVEKGRRLIDLPKAKVSAEYRASRLDRLPDEHKRFENPHIYKVGLGTDLHQQRRELIRDKTAD